MENFSSPIGLLSFSTRILNIPEIIFYYIKTFLYPAQLSIDQRWIVTSVNMQQFYMPLLFDLLFFLLFFLGGLSIYKKNNHQFKIYLFFILWFLAGIALHLQIFPLDMTVADRWFYFPMVGLLGAIGSLSIEFNRRHLFKNLGYIIAMFIIVLLSARTIVRNTNWHNALTLYSHDVFLSDNYDLEDNLAGEYQNIGNYDDAFLHQKKSVQMFPYEINLYNLGYLYEKTSKMQQAAATYEKALTNAYNAKLIDIHLNITFIRYAYVLLELKDYKTASFVINAALKEYPENTDLWKEFVYVQYQLHNQKTALEGANQLMILLPGEQTTEVYNRTLNGLLPFIFEQNSIH
ncbi:MAG: tetratricopeptide repeat protein [Candidatus Levyibacteriota bacterium]